MSIEKNLADEPDMRPEYDLHGGSEASTTSSTSKARTPCY